MQSSPKTEGSLKPQTDQPPLYPLTIAGLIYLGLSSETAGLAIPMFFLLASILLVSLVLYYQGGHICALIGTFIFVLSLPLYQVSAMVWTESMFIFFCLSILVLSDYSLKEIQDLKSSKVLHVSIGVLAGLAFATRYIGIVFVLFLVLVYLWRYLRNHDNEHILNEAAIALLCFGTIVGLIVARNYIVSQTLVGNPRPPSDQSFSENLILSFQVLRYNLLPLPIFHRFLFPQGLLIFLASPFVAILAFSDRSVIRRILPGIFCLLYLLTLCFLRSQSHFDPIDIRLLSPLLAIFVFWMASSLANIVSASTSASKELLRSVAVVVVIVVMASQISGLVSIPKRNHPLRERWPGKEAAEWLSDKTTGRETIIAVRSHYLLRRLPDRLFLEVPHTPYQFKRDLFQEGDLARIARKYSARYLVIFNESKALIGRCGPYIMKMYEGKSSPNVDLVKKTKDALIFEIGARDS